MINPHAASEPVFRLGSSHQISLPDAPEIRRDGSATKDDLNFDEVLDEMSHDLAERPHHERGAVSANPSSTPANHLDAPAHFIRRAIQELDSGSLDELLINRLLQFDRDSAEFRQEYVRLRVESLMRPRASFIPTQRSHAAAPPDATAPHPKSEELHNPWQIHRLRDLWSFFGPWLTVVTAIQFYASLNLSKLIDYRGMLPEARSPHIASLLIVCLSLSISAVCLRGLRGRDFHDFAPRLLGITGASAIAAISFHMILYHL